VDTADPGPAAGPAAPPREWNESEERLRLLADSLPDSALYQFTYGPDGSPRFLYLSAGIERLTGVRVEDALRDGRLLLGQIVPEHLPALAEASARSARELSDLDVEVQIRRADGELRWMRLNARPRRWPDGRVVWDGVRTDITERRRAEEEMRLTTARFHAALSASPVVVFNQDRELRYTWVHNPALGHEAREVLGKRDADLFPGDAGMARTDAIKRAVLESGVARREEVTVRHDGVLRSYDLLVQPLRDAAGAVVGVTCTAVDVTERKAMEDKLRAGEERFRRIFEHAPTGIAITDADGRFLQCNAAYCAILGYTEEELRGQPFDALVHPDDRPGNVAEDRRLRAATQPSFAVQNRYVRRDGATVWVQKFLSVLPDATGAPGQVLALVTDITERRRAEDALREADRRKDEFLAMLGHELRNPLAPIRNAAQLLRLRGPRDPALDGAHGMIERQLGHLVRLVDDLLDVSRVSRGQITLQRGTVDVVEIVRQTVETSRALLDARGHALTLTVPAGPVHVDGDATRLSQVVHNVLNNAVKYTDEGGQIGLTVELRGEGEGAEAVVRVRDTGRGIDPAALSSVFDLFYQVDRNLDRSEGGLGIGLSLVKRLVEMHGGRVEAHSAGPGRGCEFVIRLPCLSPTAAALPPEPLAAPAPAGRGLRVLVVDDNLDAAEAMAMLVAFDGHETRSAHDGEEAVAVALAERPDVVLLDIGLPRLNGYEACRAMRAGGLTAALIVALTGYGQEDDRRLSVEAGFDAHEVKPVELPRIRALLAARAQA
jgi:PAS domain S-box-containing protein